MKYNILYQFAANGDYNCGAYGGGAYNETACTTGTGTGSDNSGGGGLANTGTDVLLYAALGVILVAASVVYLIRNIVKAKRASNKV